MRGAIAYGYCNSRSKATKADEEIGCKDSAVIVQRSVKDIRSDSFRYVQAGVISNDS